MLALEGNAISLPGEEMGGNSSRWRGWVPGEMAEKVERLDHELRIIGISGVAPLARLAINIRGPTNAPFSISMGQG